MRVRKNMALVMLLCAAVTNDTHALCERNLNRVVAVVGVMSGAGAAALSNAVNCCTQSCGMVEGGVVGVFTAFFADIFLSMFCPERLLANVQEVFQRIRSDRRLQLAPSEDDFIERMVYEQERKDGFRLVVPLSDALSSLKRLRQQAIEAQTGVAELLTMSDPPAQDLVLRRYQRGLDEHVWHLDRLVGRLERSDECRQECQWQLRSRVREITEDWD